MAGRTVEYQIEPAHLLHLGPYITVSIRGHTFRALLDTGAGGSSIDLTIAGVLNLPQNGTQDSTGVTGKGTYPKFAVDVYIPRLKLTLPSPVPSLPLMANGLPWAVIVGRDVLCRYDFGVDGRTGTVRLTSS